MTPTMSARVVLLILACVAWELRAGEQTADRVTGAVAESATASATALSVETRDYALSPRERFASAETHEVPDFQRHIVPLFGRLGCNGRSCHGSFQGRGGLRLSLFGYDFEMDEKALHADASSDEGKRVNLAAPERSLVLQKPTLQVDHEGGERFEADSWEYHLLRRWIEADAKGILQPRELSHLEVEPAEVVFAAHADADPESVELRVVAVWHDGQREDVTPLCRYRTNDDSVVTVNRDGVLQSVGPGDTHVIAFYDNGVQAVPVMRAMASPVMRAMASPVMRAMASGANSSSEIPESRPPGIDRWVLEKLDKLQIVPSEICTDTEFLRRVSLDLTGTLPAPDEIEAFLADSAEDKRQRKIDELLERPAYAAWWANKLCDFTGCNPSQQAELGQETSVQWYMWIYARLLENVPYDQLIRRIVLARSRSDGQSYDAYASEVSSYYREQGPADFAARDTMPHYWTRRSMQEPSQAAEAFAHNFLGIRLQCAQCHKHPFAPWTQEDYREFSRFFETVKFGVDPQAMPRYRELAEAVGLEVRDDKGTAIRSDVLRKARNGQAIPWRELFVVQREEEASLDLLRSGQVTLAKDEDPRLPIAEWMTDPENGWFARAFVNRVWAGYFHLGVIDPPDDLNPANPPSNPQLLDWLAKTFVQKGYDMKWLHREVVSSESYQRSWKPSVNNGLDRRNFSRHVPRRLPAEVVYDVVKQSLAASDQADEVRTDLSRRASGHLSMRLAGTYAMQVFGKPDRAVNCDCERDNQPTLLQSVFLQNDPLMEQRLEESGWLAEVAQQGSSAEPEELVREAWLRTASRPPTAEEAARCLEHLESVASIEEGLRDLMWALINTKEFILIK